MAASLSIMRATIHIIALRTIRHSDRHNILTAYSLEHGRVALAVSAGAGRAASRMRALLMPLSVVECEIDVKPGREVHTLLRPRAMSTPLSLSANPVKTSLSLFLAELLSSIVRDGPADPTLWNYIAASIGVLDSLPTARVANFHITFLCGLARILGIAPDTAEFHRGMIFDIVDGRFRTSPPLHTHFLTAAESGVVATLGRLNYRNMHRLRLSRDERARVLDTVISYFSLHYAPISSLKSLEIVRML